VKSVLVEACVDSIESALAAEAGGAGRIELCGNLVEGGTTPSAGTIAACRSRLTIPIFVLVRPRGGDFLYSDLEQEVILDDIVAARDRGADGVAVGALRADGTVDAPRVAAMVEAAGTASVTFHRAFDVSRDAAESLEALVALGVSRVLTSGQAPTALEGTGVLAALVGQAAGRITILAAGGIHEDNVGRIVAEARVREVHVRGTAVVESRMEFRSSRVSMGKAFLPDDYRRAVTDPGRIRRISERVAATSS
jgi:copper homeostasis protein